MCLALCQALFLNTLLKETMLGVGRSLSKILHRVLDLNGFFDHVYLHNSC